MSDKTVEIVEQNKSITVQEDGRTVVIDSAVLNVVTVGIQGPGGPNAIGGKSLPQEETPVDGDLLRYNSSTNLWEFTQEIDAGTF